MNREIASYLEFVRPHYDNRDTAHDFRHIERIVSRLGPLSEGLDAPPRLRILYFFAAFHGLWPRWRDDPEFRAQAEQFLSDQGWSESEIDQASQALERRLRKPVSIEDQIVHDANYIELLGAFGIAKAFTVGGARGQTYEETAAIFEENLDRVEFLTPAGKRLAEEGRAYAKDFMERLREEW